MYRHNSAMAIVLVYVFKLLKNFFLYMDEEIILLAINRT